MKLLRLLTLLTFFTAQAQENFHRGCISTIPFQQSHCNLHQGCQSKAFFRSFRTATTTSIVDSASIGFRIKVAVHVLYDDENSVQNISDSQIASQIEILNKDFRRKNDDATSTPDEFMSVAADTRIEFELDTIIRVLTTKSSWNVITSNGSPSTDYDDMKFSATNGSDALDTEEYLNIWVAALTNSLLGYAQFPSNYYSTPSPSTDGVVVDYRVFGNEGTATFPYDEGRTATHEVGHWLGLYHTWGDGNCSYDDIIDDTPNCSGSYLAKSLRGCIGPGNQCREGNRMIENYMDYSDDGCMNLFTEGQADLMRNNLYYHRSGVFEEFLIPIPAFTYDKYLVEVGDTITFTSNTINSDSLYWQLEGASTEEFYNDIVVKVAYDSVGIYSVSLTSYDEDDKPFTLLKEHVIEVETFIPDEVEDASIDNPLIYPNPSPGNVYSLTNIDKIRTLALYNSKGELLESFSFSEEGQAQIDINDFKEGIYFLKIITEDGSKVMRLVKRD